MMKLAAACNRIAHETGAAVIVIHHTTKDGKHYWGHSSLKDNTYGFHEVSKDDNYITLSRIRVKNTGGDFTRRFGLLTITLGDDEDGDPITSTVPVPAAKVEPSETMQPGERKILEMIALAHDSGDTLTTGKLQKWAKDDLDISKSTVLRRLGRLRSLGYVSPKDDASITPTGAGRTALHTEDDTIGATGGLDGEMWTINTQVVSKVSPPFSSKGSGWRACNARSSTGCRCWRWRSSAGWAVWPCFARSCAEGERGSYTNVTCNKVGL
jgi:hypothetical protein